MDRREFLLGSFAAMAAGATAKARADEPAAPAVGTEQMIGASVFEVRPYAQLLEEDEIGLCWLTSVPATGYVTWSQDGWKTERRSWLQRDGLRDSNTRVHRAVIAEFNPRLPLLWRAHSRPIASFGGYRIEYAGDEVTVEGKLKPLCPDSSRLSFAMVNDVHTHVENYPPLMDCVKEPVDFTVFAGDILTETSSEDALKRGLLAPLAYVTERTGAPCWYLRGNHETRGNFSRRFRDYLLLKQGHFYGGVTIGPARIVFIDTGEDKRDDHKEYFGMTDFEGYLDEQARWLRREMTREDWRSAKFRIAVQHIPAKPATDLPRLKRLTQLLIDGGAQAMFAAHWHRQGYYEPCPERPFPMVVGGGHSLGDKKETHQPTLTRCDIAGDTMRIRQFFAASGKLACDHTVNARA